MQNEHASGPVAAPDPNQIGEGELTHEEQIYKENILDHYRHPHNKRPLRNPTVSHAGRNPLCGDVLTVSVTLEGDIVKDVGFDGSGCAISQASMSMLSDELRGKTAASVHAMTAADITKMLGIPIGVVRMKCAMLGLRTTQNALAKI